MFVVVFVVVFVIHFVVVVVVVVVVIVVVVVVVSLSHESIFFSLVNRNTGALSRCIKIETLERKVVIGSAIRKHGFIFHYKNGNTSSSDDDE